MFIPLGELPRHHANRLGPERWCLKHDGETLSWGELDRRSTRRAWALKALGVGHNDLVSLGLPNCSALYEWTFAIWKVGATPSMVSWRLPAQEFKAIVEVAAPKALISADPQIQRVFGALPVEYGLAEGRDEHIAAEPAAHWKAMTSGGSTGRPKVIVDHAPAIADPDMAVLGMPQDKVVLNPGPCYHNAPFAMSHTAMLRGNSVVGMPRFEPEAALRLIAEHRVAWIFFVPTMMNRIWRLPEEVRGRYDVSSLEVVWHSAAPMPAWLKQNWIDWLGAEKIWEMYGGTERQGLTIINGLEWLAHRGSVGKPVGSQVRIVGEDGRILSAGETGEINMKPDGGTGTTYHYLGAQPKAGTEGFETIGDFGWLDGDGYLYIADRRTDMIVSGGANIYPAEVESALLEHPGVEMAVVVGLPDEDMGATVHAIIQSNPAWPGTLDEEQMKRFLADRLVRYKMPRSFEFTRQTLRDDAGKVRRSQLRQDRIDRRAAAVEQGTELSSKV